MRTTSYFAGLALVSLLVLSTMAQTPKGPPTKRKPSAARLEGMKAAIADLEKGTLMQKEYPPLPYPPGYTDFIRLLESRCGVEWQVVTSTTDSKELREKLDGYNDVMRAEIEHRFGRDIFEKLQKKANAK
jgi:hypothetical protein